MPKLSRVAEEAAYEEAARAYERTLMPEVNLAEAPEQATQRKITLESLDQVHDARPEVQVFNELLVQYQRPRDRTIYGVVPDNMVVVWPEPLTLNGSFVVKHQPARPYWVLEYVSRSNERKDYERNFTLYERDLKVPYYMIFYPEIQELSLFRLREGRYVSVTANKQERCAIPKLELELALVDGWVRYWFRGELLLLPAQLQQERDKERQARAAAEQRATEATQRAAAAEDENARLRAELESLRSQGKP